MSNMALILYRAKSTCDTNIQFKTLNITIFLILTILL